MADFKNLNICNHPLATGNSAVVTLDKIKGAGAQAIKLACLVAAPEGVVKLDKMHPDVPVYIVALDR